MVTGFECADALTATCRLRRMIRRGEIKPERHTTLRMAYKYGFVVGYVHRALVAWGRGALDLDIADESAGGWFIKSGWLVVKGRADHVLLFMEEYDRVAYELEG